VIGRSRTCWAQSGAHRVLWKNLSFLVQVAQNSGDRWVGGRSGLGYRS
jgi:hypothetical protein